MGRYEFDFFDNTFPKAEYNLALRRGKIMYQQLNNLFRQISFNPQLISQSGVACFDVEYGPEIEAFKPYQPKQFWVSEPPSPNFLKYGSDDKQRVMTTLGGRKINIIREEYLEVLQRITDRVALCTLLNIWPHNDELQTIMEFIEKSNFVLISQGITIVSVVLTQEKKILEETAKLADSKYRIELIKINSDNPLSPIGIGSFILISHAIND